MPTNLNALIRYKQIDTCLKNKFIECTIEKLQDACTASLGEFRGIYKKVSERTIRDDIRVMKSNILGFNAPIEISNGTYYYTDKNYSIFTTPVTEIELLKDILKMLLEERNNIADSEIDNLLLRIANIVGEPIPDKFNSPSINFNIDFEASEDDGFYVSSSNKIEPTHKSLNKEPVSQYKSMQTLLWKEILMIL